MGPSYLLLLPKEPVDLGLAVHQDACVPNCTRAWLHLKLRIVSDFLDVALVGYISRQAVLRWGGNDAPAEWVQTFIDASYAAMRASLCVMAVEEDSSINKVEIKAASQRAGGIWAKDIKSRFWKWTYVDGMHCCAQQTCVSVVVRWLWYLELSA
eukprot:1159924-Pelagomonas_calceolata.AAC.13